MLIWKTALLIWASQESHGKIPKTFPDQPFKCKLSPAWICAKVSRQLRLVRERQICLFYLRFLKLKSLLSYILWQQTRIKHVFFYFIENIICAGDNNKHCYFQIWPQIMCTNLILWLSLVYDNIKLMLSSKTQFSPGQSWVSDNTSAAQEFSPDYLKV